MRDLPIALDGLEIRNLYSGNIPYSTYALTWTCALTRLIMVFTYVLLMVFTYVLLTPIGLSRLDEVEHEQSYNTEKLDDGEEGTETVEEEIIYYNPRKPGHYTAKEVCIQ